MRKLVYSAALATTAITLSACSDGGADVPATDTEMTDAGTGEDMAADAAMGETSGVLDANAATEEELAAIEGVGPELAAAIVAGRPYDNVGAFNAALLETLGEEEAAAVRERVFVPINLNTASREDIELIPGMTDRMVHEFEEYRPYEDMAEFDREIGKYVDEEEVARFRQYVTL